MYVRVHNVYLWFLRYGACIKVRGQLCGVDSLDSPVGTFWELNSGLQAYIASAFTLWIILPGLGRVNLCLVEATVICTFFYMSLIIICNWYNFFAPDDTLSGDLVSSARDFIQFQFQKTLEFLELLLLDLIEPAG